MCQLGVWTGPGRRGPQPSEPAIPSCWARSTKESACCGRWAVSRPLRGRAAARHLVQLGSSMHQRRKQLGRQPTARHHNFYRPKPQTASRRRMWSWAVAPSPRPSSAPHLPRWVASHSGCLKSRARNSAMPRRRPQTRRPSGLLLGLCLPMALHSPRPRPRRSNSSTDRS